jgi:hypothetical protein
MVKKGEKYECETCGVILIVDEVCDCAPCDIVCCGAPMKVTKSKTNK